MDEGPGHLHSHSIPHSTKSASNSRSIGTAPGAWRVAPVKLEQLPESLCSNLPGGGRERLDTSRMLREFDADFVERGIDPPRTCPDPNGGLDGSMRPSELVHSNRGNAVDRFTGSAAFCGGIGLSVPTHFSELRSSGVCCQTTSN